MGDDELKVDRAEGDENEHHRKLQEGDEESE